MGKTLSQWMDEAGFPAEDHPDANELMTFLAERLGGPIHDDVAAFLRRSIHNLELQADPERAGSASYVVTFEAMLIEDVSEAFDAGDALDKAIPFADDGGGRWFFLDPTNRCGLGATAVYFVGMGVRDVAYAELVAHSLGDFLAIFAAHGRAVDRPLKDQR